MEIEFYHRTYHRFPPMFGILYMSKGGLPSKNKTKRNGQDI